jgi:hypothetical protein
MLAGTYYIKELLLSLYKTGFRRNGVSAINRMLNLQVLQDGGREKIWVFLEEWIVWFGRKCTMGIFTAQVLRQFSWKNCA